MTSLRKSDMYNQILIFPLPSINFSIHSKFFALIFYAITSSYLPIHLKANLRVLIEFWLILSARAILIK